MHNIYLSNSIQNKCPTKLQTPWIAARSTKLALLLLATIIYTIPKFLESNHDKVLLLAIERIQLYSSYILVAHVL